MVPGWGTEMPQLGLRLSSQSTTHVSILSLSGVRFTQGDRFYWEGCLVSKKSKQFSLLGGIRFECWGFSPRTRDSLGDGAVSFELLFFDQASLSPVEWALSTWPH